MKLHRSGRLPHCLLAMLAACACVTPTGAQEPGGRDYSKALSYLRDLNERRDPDAEYRNYVAQPIRPDGIDGALVIHGGGEVTLEVGTVFFRLGGKEQGHLVIIPTASDEADSKDAQTELLRRWDRFAWQSKQILHAKRRSQADDPEFVKPLQTATAVWISGGWHGRLANAYVGTLVEQALYALQKRGGVIGGSSAGAGIQSRIMLAIGRDAQAVPAVGLDLLLGGVVDQHFSQREHEPRLTTFIKKYPQLFGVGIDEATALVVRRNQMVVLGRGGVSVYLARAGEATLQRRVVRNGEQLDLVELQKEARGSSAPVQAAQ